MPSKFAPRTFVTAALAAAVAMPMIASAPAQAQYYDAPSYDGYRRAPQAPPRGYGGYDGYGDRRVDYYRGPNRRYYQDCRRSNGTTGAIAGGAGGAILGSVLGGGTLGTVLGAVGGGVLGRSLDKKHDTAQNYRNGC